MSNAERFPGLLRPFHVSEVITIAEAAKRVGRSREYVRDKLIGRFHIGRPVAGGQYGVSKVALQLLMDDNHDALHRYLAGDRTAPDIVATFDLCGVPIVRQSRDAGTLCTSGN